MTAHPGRVDESTSVLSRLLLPPGGRWVAARRWRANELYDRRTADVLYGEIRTRGTGGALAAVRHALARERTIARLRLAPGPRRATVHRFPRGGELRRGGLNTARRWVRGGAVIELRSPTPAARLLDRVLSDAGVERTERLSVGTNGGILLGGTTAGMPVLLRVGRVAAANDPSWAGQALRRLEDVPAMPAPGLLGHGRAQDMAWTVESRLTGAPVGVLPAGVLAEVAEAFAQLPRTGRSSEATASDLTLLARAFPAHGRSFARVADRTRRALDRVPGVLVHRDLWPGNVLVTGARLAGVVDWEAWQLAGPPGADLLQLHTAADRLRRREGIGPTWLRRPWREPWYLDVTARYWRTLGLTPDEQYLDAVAVAWWAAEVAGTLTRVPCRRHDASWVAAHVTPVLAALDGRTSSGDDSADRRGSYPGVAASER